MPLDLKPPWSECSVSVKTSVAVGLNLSALAASTSGSLEI